MMLLNLIVVYVLAVLLMINAVSLLVDLRYDGAMTRSHDADKVNDRIKGSLYQRRSFNCQMKFPIYFYKIIIKHRGKQLTNINTFIFFLYRFYRLLPEAFPFLDTLIILRPGIFAGAY